ncbi:MAG TPA: hypothetical protein VH442_07685 [Micromonosporaceae bacterium]
MTEAVERYADLASRVLARPARLGGVRLVAIDGPSGTGKTTFARRLAAALSALVDVEVVPTDAFLRGWSPPLSVWPELRSDVLDPIASGEPGSYRPYDWTTNRVGEVSVEVRVPDVLVLEGVTSAREAVRAELSFAVFVTGDATRRFARSLARDGEEVAAALRDWQAAENMYFNAERPADRADLVVDGTTDLRHDPEREYVRRYDSVRRREDGAI